jgi:hypothetical protein
MVPKQEWQRRDREKLDHESAEAEVVSSFLFSLFIVFVDLPKHVEDTKMST